MRISAGLIAFLPVLMFSTPASAFIVDEGNTSTPAKAQLSDPDDILPVPMGMLNLSGGRTKDTSEDAASVRYDYDPQNGTFVPRSAANDQ